MSDTLTVAINAQVGDNQGGRGLFVRSLIKGLSSINADGIKYVLVTNPEFSDWPEPYISDNMDIVPRPWQSRLEKVKCVARPLIPYIKSLALPLVKRYRSASGYGVPESDGFWESLGADVVHFPYRDWVQCDLPMVYNLGDLQHLHFPNFFDDEVIERRKKMCPTGCEAAEAVITASDFVSEDIVDNYSVAESKVHTVLRGSPSQFFSDEGELDLHERFDIGEEFLLYPSKKWEHKNHLALIEALAEIKDRYGEPINLVCTGKNAPKEQFAKITDRISELGLEQHVSFLGFVDESELLKLYQSAAFVVFPTLFEGQGFPLVEAFQEGTPIACSSIAPLQEYGGDAPMYFNPESVDDMVQKIYNLYVDDDVRARHREASERRGEMFDWRVTAETYRAVYRKVAGEELTNRERSLLELKGLERSAEAQSDD